MQETCHTQEDVFCQTYLESSCSLHGNQWWQISFMPLQRHEYMGKEQALASPDTLETRALSFSPKIPLRGSSAVASPS